MRGCGIVPFGASISTFPNKRISISMTLSLSERHAGCGRVPVPVRSAVSSRQVEWGTSRFRTQSPCSETKAARAVPGVFGRGTQRQWLGCFSDVLPVDHGHRSKCLPPHSAAVHDGRIGCSPSDAQPKACRPGCTGLTKTMTPRSRGLLYRPH
jgi:hypothetical protein